MLACKLTENFITLKTCNNYHFLKKFVGGAYFLWSEILLVKNSKQENKIRQTRGTLQFAEGKFIVSLKSFKTLLRGWTFMQNAPQNLPICFFKVVDLLQLTLND
jgi:hypothetical protein